MSRKYDVAIIGCGPAGLSAALYVRRANLTCIVIGKDYGSLTKADSIENYFEHLLNEGLDRKQSDLVYHFVVKNA